MRRTVLVISMAMAMVLACAGVVLAQEETTAPAAPEQQTTNTTTPPDQEERTTLTAPEQEPESTSSSAALAASSLVNGNFERGDLTGWSVGTTNGGNASAVTRFEYCPPTWWGCGPEGGLGNTYTTPPQEGSYFALLTSGYQQSEATRISQPFEASNGDKVSGWAFFQTESFSFSGCIGSEAIEDKGQVVITGGSGSTVATPFEQSVSTVPSPQHGGNSGWTYWEYTFTGLTGTGQFQIETRVQNNSGTGGVSRVGLDDVKTSTDGTDTTPPETYITSGPCGVTSTSATTFEFSSNEQGSTFKCQLSKEGTVVQPWADCTSPKSYSNLSRHEVWETTYKFDVRATDPAGNVDPTPASRSWFIDKGPSDTTAPNVDSVVPKEGATGVNRTANVTATFSEDVLASSINGQTFKLFKKGSTTKIAATVSYPDPNSSPYTAKLDPSNSLRRGATYKAVVTTGAKDLAGNPLAQQYPWFFKVS